MSIGASTAQTASPPATKGVPSMQEQATGVMSLTLDRLDKGWKPSPLQFRRYALDDFERLPDDPRLEEWLSDVDPSGAAPVGLWRCPSGAVTCAEGMCDDDCGCCENDSLWESPRVAGWEPECLYCGRKAALVLEDVPA